MGWNDLTVTRPSALIDGLDGEDVYFAHSFAVEPEDDDVVVAVADHDGRDRRGGRARARRRRPVPPGAQRARRRPAARERAGMVKKRVIPCLDVAGGRVVKGVNFVDLREMGEPIELATRYSELGADELVFLDITATLEGRGPILELIERAAAELTIPFTVGGGVTGLDDARVAPARRRRQGGASTAPRSTTRRSSPRSPTSSARRPSSARSTRKAGEVVTHAGQDAARPRRGRLGAARRSTRGAGELLVTSIDADGTRAGYDLPLTRAFAEAVEVPVIASGGAGEAAHLAEAFAVGAEAAIIASIVHERPERLPELKAELKEAGWNVRI